MVVTKSQAEQTVVSTVTTPTAIYSSIATTSTTLIATNEDNVVPDLTKVDVKVSVECKMSLIAEFKPEMR